MIELRPHDFQLHVCLNHLPPHFKSSPWCHPVTYEDRMLTEYERKLIADRKMALQKRLTVVETPREVWSVVLMFLSGGFNPEIDERVTKVKGEHL